MVSPFPILMPQANLPTMDDVAAHAGYARATVSMALRQDPRIRAATRQRIVAAARQLGYKPNPLVAALMTTRRMQRVTAQHTELAFITTHSDSDPLRQYQAYLSFYSGAKRRATELGYSLKEFPLRTEGQSAARCLQILRARNIHGLLMAPLPRNQKTVNLDFTGFAVVGAGLSIVEPAIERVANDHFQSAVLAVRHCLALGYRRVGLVVSEETSQRLDHRWLSGFLLASREFLNCDRVRPLMPERQEQIKAELTPWCCKERPDVVLFGNISAQYPLAMPPGVDWVSLDVERLDGDVTGIFQDSHGVGTVAVEHLVARMQRGEFGPDDRASLHLFAGQWAPGRTATGPRSHAARKKTAPGRSQ
jgi:DNA-binding LacI/PurR family transcriptional regulator